MKLEEYKRRRKAVAVAKDVLKWVSPSRAATGHYIFEPLAERVEQREGNFSRLSPKAQAKVAQKTKTCSVCALGACFISTIAKYGGPGFGSYIQDTFNVDSMRATLHEVFSDEQLNEIETAYEKNLSFRGSQKAESFGCRYVTDIGRLRAIMRNIIANKGVFIP